VLGADSETENRAMSPDDGDEFVAFQDVTVVRSTQPALLCSIAGKEVWLLRRHLAGKLWCAGDRGKLLVRRSVARDRQLILPRTH
jgi:hypothetical protein